MKFILLTGCVHSYIEMFEIMHMWLISEIICENFHKIGGCDPGTVFFSLPFFLFQEVLVKHKEEVRPALQSYLRHNWLPVYPLILTALLLSPLGTYPRISGKRMTSLPISGWYTSEALERSPASITLLRKSGSSCIPAISLTTWWKSGSCQSLCFWKF